MSPAMSQVSQSNHCILLSRMSVSDKRYAYLSHINPSIQGSKLLKLIDKAINVTMQGRLLFPQRSGAESRGK